jgi:hypothetical protein
MVSGTGTGGTGAFNLVHNAQTNATAGSSKMPASTIPTHPPVSRLCPSHEDQKIDGGIFEKSTLSANRDTEPMASATTDSTAK